MWVHERAHVTPDCRIGAGTRVWQFASVVRGAVVGSNCSIADSVTLDGAVIGDGVRIQKGAFVPAGVTIGNCVFIGMHAAFCNDAWPRVHRVGYHPELFDAGHRCVVVEDGASIGAHVTVLPGVRIGSNAMIAAGEVVTGDVPPGHIYRGGVSRKFHRDGERMRWAV